MKDKRYKPGQLVTIDGQVFRIIDGNKQTLGSCYLTCRKCFAGNNEVNICAKQILCTKYGYIKHGPINSFCCDLPYGYYLKRVTPKHI